MLRRIRAVAPAMAVLAALVVPATVASAHRDEGLRVTVLTSTALGGLGSGSTIGPDGAVYATNGLAGTLVRVDPRTGATRTVGRGLPPALVGIGGAMDVVFLGHRAYVLVTLAGTEVGGSGVMGIYRLERDGTFSVFADIGAFSVAHPPVDPDWFLAEGVQYSIEVWRDRFVVADAHHGRVLQVDRRGDVSELVAFPSTDSVPTGLESADGTLYLAQAGPIPHLPSTSTIGRIGRDGTVTTIGRWGAAYTGNRGLIVDVEQGRRGRLYGLLQGFWDLPPTPDNEGFPASPGTGEIVEVTDDGTFRTVVGGLDQPTSLEFDGHVAYVVTVTGTVLRIDGM